jgi:hypothetical protein
MSLNVLDVVQLVGQGVVDVNNDDLPVGFLLIEKSHDAEDLDLLDVARLGNQLTNLANVERVVVTFGLGFGMYDVGVFPCLRITLAWVHEQSSRERT